MSIKSLMVAGCIASFASCATAEDISTHILNIATGEGGAGIPVTLEIHDGDAWSEIGSATTEENGRVEGFGIETEGAMYRLTFDMSGYRALGAEPFFPTIDIVFDIQDPSREHHVPVLVSPFGFSTYLGN